MNALVLQRSTESPSHGGFLRSARGFRLANDESGRASMTTRDPRHRPPIQRCAWASDDETLAAYHDSEWGRPEHDDRKLFEFLVLEGAQAGLSWLTVLKRRDAYRRAFDHFDPARVARYDSGKVRTLLADPGIIRNRLKIQAAISNASAF